MHRFNNPTISRDFDAARTLSKQTVTLNINNIVMASKLTVPTLTEHSFSYLHLLEYKGLLYLFSVCRS